MREEEKRNSGKKRGKALRKARIEEELTRYGSGILDSEEMRRAYEQTHHTLSTVGDHTLRVAKKSLAICHALDRLHISTDIPAVVAGALCHDLGILGREARFSSPRERSRRHPADSVEVARKLVGELPDKSTDIISRHMWPAGRSKPPNSLEAAIVCAADKLAAVEDFVRGYEEKRPGVKGVVREIRERKRRERREE